MRNGGARRTMHHEKSKKEKQLTKPASSRSIKTGCARDRHDIQIFEKESSSSRIFLSISYFLEQQKK